MTPLLLRSVVLSITVAVAAIAGEPGVEGKRKSIPIGDQWNLSGAELEKSQMAGERVARMTAKGDAKLKRGRNPLVGPWILEATAASIEADFAAKKFVLRAPFVLTRKAAGGGATEISSTSDETTAELLFRNGEIKVDGPNKVRGNNPEPAPKHGEGSPAK